ncbi:MFS transporter [Actinocorallia longicatena]|uniref:MFS transporter n=1 Tax=Actinocorallia longicatena TaxID=111803 RepID=A0ABP6QBS9_9ACTN
MANPYRALFAVPGARAFIPASFVGRMSMSMLGIGIVLMVTGTGRSYGLAGAVSATCALSWAAFSPFTSRLVDRHGQGRVLVPMVTANAFMIVALIMCAELGAPDWTLFPAAALAGITSPNLSAMIRARWSHLLAGGGPPLHSAYSLESVLDEVVFVCGPMLVSVLATVIYPAAGVLAAGLFTLVGCLALAGQRASEPPARPREQGGGRSVLRLRGMPVVITVFLMLGMVFGSADVGAIAFADEQGRKALSGAVLACFALGSGTAGLWYGTRHWKRSLSARFRIGLGLLTAGLLPLGLIGSLPLLMVMIFFAGLAISPTIIPAYGLVEAMTPERQLTEGLGWSGAAIGVGVALGSSIGGQLIDLSGASASFTFAFAAGLAAVLAGLLGGSRFDNKIKHEFSS